MFSCNVDGILNDLPGVAFIDKAADWKAAPIGGFNMPPEHSVSMEERQREGMRAQSVLDTAEREGFASSLDLTWREARALSKVKRPARCPAQVTTF
jgi:hypothetical protein